MEINKIYKGDSIEVLKMLPSESIDFIFADPPYYMQTEGELLRTDGTKFNGVEDEWDKFESFQDYDNFTKQWLGECRRVLKKNGTIAVIGSFQNIYRVGNIMQDLGYWILNDIIWKKTNPVPNFSGKRFCNAHETILWCSKDKKSKITFNYKTMKFLNGDKQEKSVWEIPLCTGIVEPAIMDVVNKGLDVFYYVEKEMPEQLLEAGRRAVKGFGIKSRFIHLEFFKLQNNKKGLGKKGDYIGLEANMRPAGGYTPDMYNYANNTDVYQIWADMIAFDKIEKAKLNENIEKNYCVYASRRDNKNYVHSHDEIKQKYGNAIVMDERMPDIFSEAMGNYMYTAKFATKEEMDEFINFVHEKTEE